MNDYCCKTFENVQIEEEIIVSNFLYFLFGYILTLLLIALLVLLAAEYLKNSRYYSTEYISDEGYGSIESTKEMHFIFCYLILLLYLCILELHLLNYIFKIKQLHIYFLGFYLASPTGYQGNKCLWLA